MHLGIVKGCICLLENNVLAEAKKRPFPYFSGHLHFFAIMAVCLVLWPEVVLLTCAPWKLTSGLPNGVDLRALFRLRLQYNYLRVAGSSVCTRPARRPSGGYDCGLCGTRQHLQSSDGGHATPV